AMPMGKLDFLGGYALAFGVVATAQAALVVALSVGPLGLDVAGPVWLLGLVAVADAVLGTALGLFVSAFARTEFQAVQFMPAVVIPQILLCGLCVPRDEMPAVLRFISDLLPLSYAVDAMQGVAQDIALSEIARDLALVVAFSLAGRAVGEVALRCQSACPPGLSPSPGAAAPGWRSSGPGALRS